jgi:hypothetical protein
MAATATNRITRIAEDLLATDTLKYSQLHLYDTALNLDLLY